MPEYISKETVLKKLQMQLLALEIDQDKGEYSELCENRGARDALDGAIYDIRTLKATDVQPIVYAHKTINVGRRSYCSNCGKLAIMEDFCSKCGAKVKEGDINGKVSL